MFPTGFALVDDPNGQRKAVQASSLGHTNIRIQTVTVKIFEFALKFLEIPAFLPFSISFPQLSPSG
jgi:hypothetical protein